MFSANGQLHPVSSRQANNGSPAVSSRPNGLARVHSLSAVDDGTGGSGNGSGDGVEINGAEETRRKIFRERFAQAEARLVALFSKRDQESHEDEGEGPDAAHKPITGNSADNSGEASATRRKPARQIDEDDYGDEDDPEGEDVADSPPRPKASTSVPLRSSCLSQPSPILGAKAATDSRGSGATENQVKSSEDVRKKLEEDKKAAEVAAKKSFASMFYTLENDRDAMLEQQKLDELDRQVENEISNQGQTSTSNTAGPQQGTLSSANLGASSLTLKHLIARIDAKRSQVQATDAQLRTLMSEVRKNRSKWANEDKIGQEELYEAAEKVLMELKANTEYAGPFLQRVNKRDAPDYHTIIKHPMDIGTMVKKLKSLQYKSKKDFVDDLNLIWANCLKYNADPAHFLRKKALYMRKETEKLVPLIPDIVVRDRAEVEAEEKRLQQLEGLEDSDDEIPIMASRGRKAHSKKSRKGPNDARKSTAIEGTPGADNKLAVPTVNGIVSNLKSEFSRADSDAPMDGSTNGFSTPPPRTFTPLGPNSFFAGGTTGSQADTTEVDGTSASGLANAAPEDPDIDDVEFKTWKYVTKKDRAMVAAERHRLFKGDRINAEEPALIRTRAGMRRWLRQQKTIQSSENYTESREDDAGTKASEQATGETLAENIEDEEERLLPDYYDTTSAIPDLNEKLAWIEDAEKQVINQGEEFLRIVPPSYFRSPESSLTRKMDANMRQMQETRKVCAKIGVVKQMQLQSQLYQNLFQKYDPQPFIEADPGPLVVSDDGPVMAPWACRATLQRSVAKIFYHAGFEEFQPSALETITDVAGDVFGNLARIISTYREEPLEVVESNKPNVDTKYKHQFTREETILHSLDSIGLDVESLESYVKDDVERLGSKLSTMHERMKAHLTDLLRPALNPNAGPDGAGDFVDGSEQFVGGDFATDIDEDFFGFKELGLDQEFGLASLSVPLHLLQNRMHNQYQAQNATSVSASGMVMQQPSPYEPVTLQNIKSQIGLIQNFFLAKLHANDDKPLPEDDDLPIKQRYPKPRLPPTGKITSPRKRPPKELQQLAKKKRKLEDGKEELTNGNGAGGGGGSGGMVNGMGSGHGSDPDTGVAGGGTGSGSGDGGTTVNGIENPFQDKPGVKPLSKLKLEVPPAKDVVPEPEKDGGSALAMMSPESIAA